MNYLCFIQSPHSFRQLIPIEVYYLVLAITIIFAYFQTSRKFVGFVLMVIFGLWFMNFIARGGAFCDELILYTTAILVVYGVSAYQFFRYKKGGALSRAMNYALLIIISIYLIIAIFIIPPSIAPPSLRDCEDNLKNYGTALEMYNVDNSGRYPESLELLTPDYFSRLPSCFHTIGMSLPSEISFYNKNSIAYRYYSNSLKISPGDYQYKVSDNMFFYTIYCPGHYLNQYIGLKENYPQYNSRSGLEIQPGMKW